MTHNLREFTELMMATFATKNPFGLKEENEVTHVLLPTNLFNMMQDILKEEEMQNKLSYLIDMEDYIKDREDFIGDFNMHLNNYIIYKKPMIDFKYEQIKLTINKELINQTLTKYDELSKKIMNDFVDMINSRFITETSEKTIRYCEKKDIQYTFKRRDIA